MHPFGRNSGHLSEKALEFLPRIALGVAYGGGRCDEANLFRCHTEGE